MPALPEIITAVTAVAFTAATVVFAADAPKQPAYEVEDTWISYFNTPNRSGRLIDVTKPTTLAGVTVNLKKPGPVLVQFSSELATEDAEGCPCSVRGMIRLNDQEPIILKRINVGSPAVQALDKYEHDRQNLDGAYVLQLPAGKHRIELLYQQVDGTSTGLEVYYINMQAIRFASSK